VASAGVLHLAASDAVPAAVGLGTTEWFDPAFTVPELQPVAGTLRLPGEAGLGIGRLPGVLSHTPGGVT